MSNQFTIRRSHLALLAAMLLLASGCAGLPRIDPSGERILVWPSQQPPAIGQPVAGFDTAQNIAVPQGNLTAPPAASNTFQNQGFLDRAINGPRVIGPAVGQPVVGQPVAQFSPEQVSGDRVTLTPSRILAPVGTEVILRAGVCTESGYLRTNQKIEWLLARQGAGQFVEVGEAGELDVMRMPWNSPKKIDNNYAVGYTSPFHTCLRRGNADPLDDIQVRPGDAWITVSSAAEGTSYITAAAPDGVSNWDTRRASATIYWVDAQWQLPPSTTVEAGRPHTLTTTVTRKSDGAPIEGWIVRYDVADGAGARLGYDASQTTEVTTDSRGRASVEVTPTDTNPGTATITTTVIRPEQAGVASSPRIDVGKGQSTVTWANGVGGGSAPVLPPIDNTPIDRPQDPVFTPPDNETPITPPAGNPQLDVTMRSLSPQPVKVGDLASFMVTVRNAGNAPARNIVVTDQYDQGLANQYDSSGKNEIEYTQMGDLAPGESDEVRLDFEVLEPGRRCHKVIVTADGATDAFDNVCFTAEPIAPTRPELRVQMAAPPRTQIGGEPSLFTATVKNAGTEPATNVVVRLRHDPSLFPKDREPPRSDEQFQRLPDGFQWTIARLNPNEERTYRATFDGQTVTPRSCVRLQVLADGGAEEIDEGCTEVLPPIGGGPVGGGPIGGPLGGGATPLPVTPRSNLRVDIRDNSGTTRINQRRTVYVDVTNTGQTDERSVVLETFIPEQVEPMFDLIKGPSPDIGSIGNERRVIVFDPIATLRPGETQTYLLVLEGRQQGNATIQARARSSDSPDYVNADQPISVAR